AVVSLFHKRQLLTRPIKNVRDELDEIRKGENRPLKKFEVDRRVSDELLRDAQERGVLYFFGQLPDLFFPDARGVIPVDLDNDDWKVLAQKYGVAPKDALMKPLIQAAYVEALQRGRKATVYPFAHYDRDRHTVYLFDLDRGVYKITTSRVDRVPNGTDGHLFVRDRKWEPFELQLNVPASAPANVAQRLLSAINFAPSALSRVESTHLFNVYVLAM